MNKPALVRVYFLVIVVPARGWFAGGMVLHHRVLPCAGYWQTLMLVLLVG